MNYPLILDTLLTAIAKRDGSQRAVEIQENLKGVIQATVNRELVVQIISQEKFHRRALFLALYPGLILPYFCRIKEGKAV